jgi:nitroreductase
MKTIFSVILAAVILLTFPSGGFAQNPKNGKAKLEVIKLASPDLAKGKPLMQALKDRKSERALSNRKLSLQHLSELLWAANGVNRKDGKRTAPAALDIQAVDIYVVMPEGVYLYDAAGTLLLPVVEGDFRKQCGMQDFVYIAPVNLVYVADLAKLKKLPGFAGNIPDEVKLNWAYIAAGCQSQNVNLYCASEGLGAVVRGSIDKEKFGKTLKLRPEQTVLSAQTIGYPK